MKLNTLKQQLPAILDDFDKYYVFYNMNPSNNEYKQMFDNIKNNLNSINSQSFVISNDVDKAINDVNIKLLSIIIFILDQHVNQDCHKECQNIYVIINVGRKVNLITFHHLNYLKNMVLITVIFI